MPHISYWISSSHFFLISFLKIPSLLTIKCNDYLDEICDMTNNGYYIIDICDSLEEYLYLKEKNR